MFVERGTRVYAVEVPAREGYDRSLCDTGVLVYKVDQTPFRRLARRADGSRVVRVTAS